jgi:hypothetical protein
VPGRRVGWRSSKHTSLPAPPPTTSTFLAEPAPVAAGASVEEEEQVAVMQPSTQ